MSEDSVYAPLEPEEDTPSAPQPEAAPAAPSKALTRADIITRVLVWALLAAVVGFAAYFAYAVWAAKQEALIASPAGRAVKNLEAVVKKNPKDLYARVRLAEAMAGAGLYDQSIDQLKQVIEADPKYVGAYEDLGLIAGMKKDWTNAEKYFLKVLDLTKGEYAGVNERRERAYFYLGQIMNEERRYQDAVGYFKASIRVRRDASDTYYNLALAYLGMGSKLQAEEQLRIAIAFDPKYSEANYELGRLQLADGKKVEAAQSFRAALDGDQKGETEKIEQALASIGTYEQWWGQAQEAWKAKDLAKALDAVSIAIAIEPQSVDAMRLRAKVYEAQGDKAHALKAWQELSVIKKDDPEAAAGIKRLGPKTKGGK